MTSLWLAIVLSFLASFLLSGLESAVLSISRVRVRHAVKEGNRAARRLDTMLEHRATLLLSILLLNGIINILTFALITHVTVNWLGPWGYGAAFVVSLPIYLFWVEFLPKSIFKLFPFRSLSFFLPVAWSIYFGVGPFIRVTRWAGRKLFPGTAGGEGGNGNGGGQDGEDALASTDEMELREQFRSLTQVFEREGTLNKDETRLIRSVLDFHQVSARDVMIPLSQVTAIPLDMPVATVLTLSRETNLDQFPVLSKDGDIVGLINVFDLLTRDDGDDSPLTDAIRRIVRARPTDFASQVIRRLRQSRSQLAAVYEDGKVPVGIVSAEDMVGRMLKIS